MKRFVLFLLWPIRVVLSRLSGSKLPLRTEVSAALPIIETLERQIRDAVEKGTTATDKLSTSFGDMASRARDVVAIASDSQSNDSEAGVDQIRDVVSELLAQVRQTSQSSQRTADMLTSIEAELQDVESCITQIEYIANCSRMVSLNGQIEAARAREHGEGFAVVASETGDLAKNVSETSHKIREVVDRMSQALKRTSDETRQLVHRDQEATAVCEERVAAMLGGLAAYQQQLEGNMEAARSSSDLLAQAISRSVMTLQFQDAVSQRMHHVTDAMSDLRGVFGTLVGSPESGPAAKRRDEWLQKISGQYCVDDERAVLLGSDSARAEAPDVVLF